LTHAHNIEFLKLQKEPVNPLLDGRLDPAGSEVEIWQNK
jgi:hypothetical protein